MASGERKPIEEIEVGDEVLATNPAVMLMWIDADGVCHTVALPDPTELMSDEFRHGLDRLIGERAEEVLDLVSTEEDRCYQEQAERWPSAPEERIFYGLPPPAGLLSTPVGTVEGLRACILTVDPRWRLDVLVALDDYLY